jgi:TyrR family helix-turn-helix protein
MLNLKSRAARMALVDAPLLITGETGTGKELLAHACHAASLRSQQPFFALNCAALPENLAESELFGYSPGAFTDALRGGKPGLLELADRGTVFLDEIGEMSPYLQAKLLRFLNDGSFRRVGGDRELKVNVRIISATHRALDDMVAAGSFRQDLLYRLNVLNLHMPPLRERPDDILPLARALLTQACTQTNHRPARLSPAASAALLTNPWVGNVRQLQNVIFRAVTMTDATVIDVADLELAGSLQHGGVDAPVESLAQAVAEFEKDLLTRMYREFPSTRRLALRLKTSHSAIAARLRRYQI